MYASDYKSEFVILGTSTQLGLQAATSTVFSSFVAGVDFQMADVIKVLSVVLYRHLTFDSHGYSKNTLVL